MKTTLLPFPAVRSGHPKANTIETNLYDLIETIRDEVQVGEDRLIVQTVLDLIETGRMKFVCPRKRDSLVKGRKNFEVVE